MIPGTLLEQALDFLFMWGFTCQEKTQQFLPVLFTSSKSNNGIKWSDSVIYCYLDLDLVMDLISFLSSSNFLSSADLVSWRFSSPSSSDLISELPDDTLWPWRPGGIPMEKPQEKQKRGDQLTPSSLCRSTFTPETQTFRPDLGPSCRFSVLSGEVSETHLWEASFPCIGSEVKFYFAIFWSRW